MKPINSNTMEKWKEEFDIELGNGKKWKMIDEFNDDHSYNLPAPDTLDCVKAFIEKVRQERYKEGYERGIREENKEWREGRRCGICGEPKAPDLSEMCSECLETA